MAAFLDRQFTSPYVDIFYFSAITSLTPLEQIDGDIYDVTAGAQSYGPNGKYHNFAGVDAARAFATACTNGHRTHDLRGLTEKQLKVRTNPSAEHDLDSPSD